MTQKTLPLLPKSRGPIRRTVRREYRAGDQIGYKTKSFTQAEGLEYHPTLDVKTGEHHCDCKSAQFNPTKVCKHVLRAAQNAVRSKEAEPSLLARLGVTCCYRCLGADELYPLCHDDGTLIPDVYVCGACARKPEAKS